MPRAIRIAAAAGAVLVLAGGCRNPFDPSCNVELIQLLSNGRPTIVMYESSELSGGSGTYNFDNWAVTARFVVKNKVAATINTISITYTDLDGNAVTAYRTIGGRTFKTAVRLAPVVNMQNPDDGEGLASSFKVYVVDKKVIEELRSPSYPDSKVMFADIVFRGVDDNGYDIRLEGRIAIFLYP